MNISTIISLIISLIIICLFIYIIIIPIPLTYIVKIFQKRVEYQPNDFAKITPDYTLYSHNNSQQKNLIVVFVGGAFVASNVSTVYGITNSLNDYFKEKYDILIFSYPVRFKYTLNDTLLHANKILSKFIHYENIHILAISAGALLAGVFCKKEADKTTSVEIGIPQIGIKFKSFIGICGVYDYRFKSDLITQLFKIYILKKIKKISYYTCYGINLPKLIISSKYDFLIQQTVDYIQKEPTKDYKIYETYLPHSFVQLINLSDSINALQRICTFISQVDDDTNKSDNMAAVL